MKLPRSSARYVWFWLTHQYRILELQALTIRFVHGVVVGFCGSWQLVEARSREVAELSTAARQAMSPALVADHPESIDRDRALQGSRADVAEWPRRGTRAGP